jgi:hypothetical protein
MDKQYWQDTWRKICDMAYYRKRVTSKITTKYDGVFLDNIVKKDYTEYTFDYIWYQISKAKSPQGLHIDALIVPELLEIYVPRVLFECAGVYVFFRYSFPNCEIHYWEDEVIV